MMMDNFDSTLATVRDFTGRRSKVQADSQYSQAGKAQRLAAIETEAQAFRPKAYDALSAGWATMRKQAEALANRKAQAEEKAGARWDFTRLTFETESARRAIMQTPDLYDAGDLFDANSKSGDAHKARGWLEVAAEAFTQKHGATVETNRIAKEAAARLAALLTTPELESAQAESEALADAALNALKATGEVGQFYDPGAGSPDNVLNEFGNLLKAVRVERMSLGGGRWQTTVHMTESEAPNLESYDAKLARLGV